MSQIRIPATYYRGGTSKGIFFKRSDLPLVAQQAGEARDKLLLRVLGSPDPYGKQIDGLGNASSSTSKAVIIDRSTQTNHDIDYLFGQVSIDKPFVDWSGNCGNLSSAVGAFAISQGLIERHKIPQNGICTIRIWQVNIRQTIIAHIPIINGEVQETGDFEIDGVAFPASEIKLEFIEPNEEHSNLFPTGNLVDTLDIPNIGSLKATLINAGIPTIFVNAHDIGYTGTESQADINNQLQEQEKLELIRAYGALKMGLIQNLAEAQTRQHTPKIAWVSPPKDYIAADGKSISSQNIDLLVRAMSMGKLHHAMMGTASIAIAAAASIPNTIVNLAAGGNSRENICFGHPSGTLTIGVKTKYKNNQWYIEKSIMSRTARIIMGGWVKVPDNCFK